MVKETAPHRSNRIRPFAARSRLWFLIPVSALIGGCVVVRLLSLMQEGSDIRSLLLQPSFSRLLLVAFCAQLCAVVLTFPGLTANGIRNRLFRTASPGNLAAARIVVFSIWLFVIDPHRLQVLASLPEPLVHSRAADGLFALLRFDPPTVYGFAVVLQLAALAALTGCCYRISSWLVACCGFYFLLFFQPYEAPYAVPLLLMMTLVLACSRAADACALEAPLLRAPAAYPPGPDLRYGFPLTLLRLCAALSAFMGVALCLWQNGLAWPLGGGIAQELRAAWFLNCHTPPRVRADNVPVLYQFLGSFELIIGLLLPCAVLSKRLRSAVSAYWLLLQCCNVLLFRFPLPELALLNAVFIDWDGFGVRLFRAVPGSKAFAKPLRFSGAFSRRIARAWLPLPAYCYVFAACALAAAAVYSTGAAQEVVFLESFPRAALLPDETAEIIGLAGYRADGSVETIKQEAMQQQLSCPLFYALHRSVAAELDNHLLGLRLAALWDTNRSFTPNPAAYRTAQFYRDSYSTVPELGNFNPADRRLLLDITFSPAPLPAMER